MNVRISLKFALFLLVLPGWATGLFKPVVSYSLGGPPIVGMAAADMNGDGRPDLVATTANSVSVTLNRGNGTFGAPVQYTLPVTGALALAVGDFDGDGHPDVAVAGDLSVSTGLVTVFLNNGRGTKTGNGSMFS